MRSELWPDARDEHAGAIDGFLAGQSAFIHEALVCEADGGAVIGFAELRVRNYAEGSDLTEVPHLEGWYVDARYRGQGVGAALMAHSEEWAKRLGYSEIASDAELDNASSIAAHRALGFKETDRLVCFLKRL